MEFPRGKSSLCRRKVFSTTLGQGNNDHTGNSLASLHNFDTPKGVLPESPSPLGSFYPLDHIDAALVVETMSIYDDFMSDCKSASRVLKSMDQGSSNNSQAPWKEINEDLDPILVAIETTETLGRTVIHAFLLGDPKTEAKSQNMSCSKEREFNNHVAPTQWGKKREALGEIFLYWAFVWDPYSFLKIKSAKNMVFIMPIISNSIKNK